MARRRRPKQDPLSAAHTLDQLETRGDRLVAWVTENPVPLIAVGVAVLVIAAIWGFVSQDFSEEDMLASAELSTVQLNYRIAMGAQPGAIEVPEPANREAGQSIREDFIQRYDQVAEQTPGTVAGTIALLEAGKLAQQIGDLEAAQTHYESGLERVPEGDVLAAFFLARLASIAELQSQWAEAAGLYARTAELPDYPLRRSALADAIRCYLEAEDANSAQTLAKSLRADPASTPLPAYVSAQLDELATAPSDPLGH